MEGQGLSRKGNTVQMQYLKNFLLLFSVGVLFLTVSCNPDRIFEENQTIPESTWDKDNILYFTTEMKDTSVAYNVYLNIRNAGIYPFSNIFLFITTTKPDGTTARDTAEFTLADADGRWLGSGMGDIWDNQVLFKRNMHFRQMGKYKFGLEQAMRVNPLPGIMDMGVRIELAKVKPAKVKQP